MNRLLILAAGCLAMHAAHGAGLYKCTDANGKVTFSQTQCAADAAPVAVTVARPTAAQIQQHQAQIEENRQFIAEGKARRQAMEDHATREMAAKRIEAERNAEIEGIRRERARAANNQAGATYEQALSQDEANVNARYEAEMDRLRGVR